MVVGCPYILAYSVADNIMPTVAFLVHELGVPHVSLSKVLHPCVALCCSVFLYVALCCRALFPGAACVALCCRRYLKSGCRMSLFLRCSMRCTVLHCVALRCTMLHCVALRCTVLHCVALYCSALLYVALCCTVPFCPCVCVYPDISLCVCIFYNPPPPQSTLSLCQCLSQSTSLCFSASVNFKQCLYLL